MELPIAGQSETATPAGLVRYAHRARLMLGRTVGEETPLEHASHLADPRHPDLPHGNRIADLHFPRDEDPATIVQSLPGRNAPLAPLALRTAGPAPEAARAALEAAGWVPRPRRLLRLAIERRRDPAGPAPQLVPARAAYAEIRALYHQTGQRLGLPDPAAEADARVSFLDEVRYEVFLARLSGRPEAACGVLTVAETGVLGELDTLQPDPGHPVTAALLAAVIEHCRRALHEHVLADVSAGGPAESLLEAIGFETVADLFEWERDA